MISLRFIEYYEILGNRQNTWNYGKTNIYIYCGGIFSSKSRVSLIVFWLFLLSHIKEFFLPPLSPLSSAHTYKAEGRGRILRCGTLQKLHKAKGQKACHRVPTIKGIKFKSWWYFLFLPNNNIF